MDYIALLIQENMKLEADSINRYKDLLSVIGDNFPTIRNIVEEIISEELKHEKLLIKMYSKITEIKPE